MGLEDDGALRENRFPNMRREIQKKNRLALGLGRVRTEQMGNEATASGTEARGQERIEHGNDDSEHMIIKKGIEWSVEYHNDESITRERGNSVAGTEESRGATSGLEDTIAIKTYI